MKKLIILSFLLLLGVVSIKAQTFIAKDVKTLTLVWYGLRKSNASGYEWQKDLSHSKKRETWDLYHNGTMQCEHMENGGTFVGYYTTSSDGKKLYQYSDKNKSNLVNVITITQSEKKQGTLIPYWILGTIDRNNIVRIFYSMELNF